MKVFRIVWLLCEDQHRRQADASGTPIHRTRHRSGSVRSHRRHFRGIVVIAGTRRGGRASSIPEPRQRVSCRPRFDFPTSQPETFQMTITAAHVPAIVALIAGILILIMPRLLNFIVAIYLIFIGLVGLGLLRMIHF
jgi:Protein of unknown function (DUF3096)